MEEELANAIHRAQKIGASPVNGLIVVDACRRGDLTDAGIEAVYVIGELLDRIEELKH